MAPTAKSPPYLSKEVLKVTIKILSVDCIIKGARPRARQGINTLDSILKYSFLIFKRVLSPVKNFTTHIAETPWEMMVARAAPFTPIPNPKIKIGSRIILRTAPTRTVTILILEKPWAVIKVLSPRANWTKRVPMA